ncbi:hypothetical protein [Hymenobacter sp. BRD67]|uniref:hypothetical protein n=1 Tax=Hymenobacter sp. BRD67 TaxID=2675877 RepID=UPI001565D44A|nr:hypothetical protein [Hymenobacter sp. BRD67]QKG54372.1 hypothetical protein GKZ67_19425 [Hymenobacter sp. BRD67]
MRRSDILTRQNRIVYTLLLVTAAIGLAWVLWRHQYLAGRESPLPAHAAAVAH